MTDVLAELRSRRRQAPFVPFVIVLKDGRRYSITHKFQYAYTDDQVVVYVYPDQDRRVFFSPADIDAFYAAEPVG